MLDDISANIITKSQLAVGIIEKWRSYACSWFNDLCQKSLLRLHSNLKFDNLYDGACQIFQETGINLPQFPRQRKVPKLWTTQIRHCQGMLEINLLSMHRHCYWWNSKTPSIAVHSSLQGSWRDHPKSSAWKLFQWSFTSGDSSFWRWPESEHTHHSTIDVIARYHTRSKSKSEDDTTVSDVRQWLNKLGDIKTTCFCQVVMLVRRFLFLAVASATAERSCSALRRLKT